MNIKYVIFIIIRFLLKEVTAQNETAPAPAPEPAPEPVPEPGKEECIDEMDNDAYIKDWEEASLKTACEWMELKDPEKLKLNLDHPMSYEDVVKLAFLNKGRKLHETFLDFPEDIKWKREIVNQMWSLFETACPDIYVREDYMNIMRELAMVYINSVEPRTSEDPEVWLAIMESLMECNKLNLPPYNFTSHGLKIKSLILTEDQLSVQDDDDDTTGTNDKDDEDKKDEEEKDKYILDLEPQMEKADAMFTLDVIIDNLWLVFSHAWARCIRKAPSKELWGPRFKQLFFRDFLAGLEDRWANPGPEARSYMDYIMGDYNVPRTQMNIPFCTEAAYVNPHGTQLESQLVRPLKVADIQRGVRKFQNERLV